MELPSNKLLQSYFSKRDLESFVVDNLKHFNAYNEPVGANEEIPAIKIDDDKNVNLYFHYPWCENRCKFCCYTSGIAAHKDNRAFIESVKNNYKLLKPAIAHNRTTSVFFGGGTPTILPPRELDDYLRTILENTNITDDTVITVETNPKNMIGDEKINIVMHYANRVSVGIQCFEDEVRRKNGIILNRTDAYKALDNISKHFDNFNVDLMYGLPFQTKDLFLDDIAFCIKSGVPSVTLYKLEFFDFGKTYSRQIKNLDLLEYTVEQTLWFYEAQQLFVDNGYIECPSGWFVKNDDNRARSWGKRIDDWKKMPQYLGIGCGAYSHLDNVYLKMKDDYQEWEESVSRGCLPIKEYRHKDAVELFLIGLLRKIRTSFELSIEDYELLESFAFEPEKMNLLFIEYLGLGFFEKNDSGYAVTDLGKSVLGWLLSDVIHACIGNHCADGRQTHLVGSV